MKRVAAVAVLTLAACNPPADGDVVSGEVERPEPDRVRVAAVDGPVTFPTTTTTTTTPTTTTVAPAVVPATTTPAVTYTGECGGWEATVRTYFGDQAAKACAVIRCETGGTFDPTAQNPRSTASGLLQFLDSTWLRARAMVARAAGYARAAHAPGDVQIEVGATWLRATSWDQWECAT